MPPKKKIINWIYDGQEITETPNDYEGLIYIIHNETKSKFYIGRKSFYSYSKKKLTPAEKLLPENKRKTFKIVKIPTKWQSYTGSCRELNDDIKSGDIIRKEVIRLCKTRKEMTIWETKEILCNCLEYENCYNNHVLGKLFRADLNL